MKSTSAVGIRKNWKWSTFCQCGRDIRERFGMLVQSFCLFPFIPVSALYLEFGSPKPNNTLFKSLPSLPWTIIFTNCYTGNETGMSACLCYIRCQKNPVQIAARWEFADAPALNVLQAGRSAIKALNINQWGACWHLKLCFLTVYAGLCITLSMAGQSWARENFYFTKSLYQGIIVKRKSI